MNYSLGDYRDIVANKDFHRSNMFSVIFATTPSSKSQELLDSMGGAIFDAMPDFTKDMGLERGAVDTALKYAISVGGRKVMDKLGKKVFLIGAMTNRVVKSVLGEFAVGTYLMDFFDMAYPTKGLQIFEVQLPDNRLSFEHDITHNAPNIKIMGRELEPLILSFRLDSDAANLRAMNDWVDSVECPITGLRSLPADVESDIQVNLHDRQGVPHTVIMFQGCIPVGCGKPKLSYDENNSISTFEVTFAYRSMSMGAVGRAAAIEWLEDMTISNIGKVADNWKGSRI